LIATVFRGQALVIFQRPTTSFFSLAEMAAAVSAELTS